MPWERFSFEMLTGRPPFTGSVLEILRLKETTEPPQPIELVPQVPEDLNQLCIGLLRRDVNERYGLQQLRDVLEGKEMLSERLTSVQSYEDVLVGREEHLGQLRRQFKAGVSEQVTAVLITGAVRRRENLACTQVSFRFA